MSAFDPERLLRALDEAGVEHVVIGLGAAFLQGNPTVTIDLDIMPRRDLDNAERLATALNALGVRRRTGDRVELEGADFLGWGAQRFLTDAGPVDIVPVAAGIGAYEDVATVELAIGDMTVRALSLDEVITSKEALDRPKDRAALPMLRATRDAVRRRRRRTTDDE
jgi:hypothetical protein